VAKLLQPVAVVLDVIVVGGGPAGLSAALVLGRCRRRVLLCDAGRPRNGAAQALHGYLTRDGIAPHDLLHVGREELRQYQVEMRPVTVTEATCRGDVFHVTLETGEGLMARSLLLATGVRDQVPDIPGMRECYGVSVHHCPYCDGWEVRDKALIVVGHGAAAAGLALSLKTWSDRVAICSHGHARLGTVRGQQIVAHGIPVYEKSILCLDHSNGHVRRVVFASGGTVPCDAIFFTSRQNLQSDLPLRFGCNITRRGVVRTDHLGRTHIPGLYVIGDASRDVQFAIVAAAEGAKAAVAINQALQEQAGLAMNLAAS
jgi:thioredoxin reductase